MKRLSFRRLSGLDRSGPPPPKTMAGEPLNPWTIPNAITLCRFLGIPVFLALAFSSDDGHSTQAALVFALIAITDYLDGIAARLTGQYSRLGTIMDPFIDRLLILSGVIVCWHFELLPRWALAVLFAREILVLFLARYGLSHGVTLQINWFGRIGVFPIMAAPFFAMLDIQWLADALLYIGLVFVLIATAKYVFDGYHQLRGRRSADSQPVE